LSKYLFIYASIGIPLALPSPSLQASGNSAPFDAFFLDDEDDDEGAQRQHVCTGCAEDFTPTKIPGKGTSAACDKCQKRWICHEGTRILKNDAPLLLSDRLHRF
jgi:hypothetical protein